MSFFRARVVDSVDTQRTLLPSINGYSEEIYSGPATDEPIRRGGRTPHP